MNSKRYPVRLLQITGDPVGGVRRHIETIITGLDNDSYNIYYVHSNVSKDNCFTKSIKKLNKSLINRTELRINKNPNLHDIINLYKVVKYCVVNDIDIIHGHGSKGGLYARIAGKLSGAKVIYTPHGGSVHNMFGKYKGKLYQIVEKMLYPLTNYFVFESHYSYEQYNNRIHKLGDNYFVNYNGINPPNISELHATQVCINISTNKNLNIGVFGSIRKEKGQIYALEAANKLVDTGVDFKLHIFGDGPERGHAEDYIQSHNLNNYIELYGDVSNTDKYMSLMDVILIPSVFESFGYVALEAMLLKKPIIATKTGGLLEVLTNRSGIMIQKENATEIYNAIIKFKKDSSEVTAIINNAYKRAVNNYSIATMLNNLNDIYLSQVKS